MKQIDTTQVVDPSTLQPFTVKSLKFLQDAKAEDDAGIIEALIRTNTGAYSTTTPYVISGCVVSDSNKDVTDGKIFYNGKFYEVTGVNGTTNVAQFILTKTQDATADPLTFTDGTNKNVHDIYKYVATDVASGGDFDATDLVSIYTNTVNQYLTLATQTFNSGAFADATGLTYTTPNDGVSKYYLINFKCKVTPSNAASDAELEISLYDGSTDLDIIKVGKQYSAFTGTVTTAGVLLYYGLVAPNTTLKIRCKNYSNTCTVDDAKFSIIVQ